MTLMAVYGKQGIEPVPTHVLACTERHHIVDHDLAFVDLELIFILCRPSDEVRVVCDRALPLLSEVKGIVSSVPAYRHAQFLEHLVNAGHTHVEQVWDFQRTYGWGGADRSYNTRYRHSYNIETVKPPFLTVHTESHAPVTEIAVAPLDHDPRLSSTVSNHGAGGWEAATPYQVRLGFFTRSPHSRSNLVRRAFLRRYTIRLLMYDRETRVRLESRQLLPAVNGCHLWIKMSAGNGLAPIRDAIAIDPEASVAELADLVNRDLNFAHTDVWVLAPTTWNLYREPGAETVEPTGHPRWLLFDSREGLRHFNAYHWVPGTSETYRDRPYLRAYEDEGFELLLTPWWLDRRRLFPTLISAIALAVGAFNLTRGLAPTAASGLAIVVGFLAGIAVLGLYALLEWLAARYRLPS